MAVARMGGLGVADGNSGIVVAEVAEVGSWGTVAARPEVEMPVEGAGRKGVRLE